MLGELRAEVAEEALEEKEMKLFGNLEDGKSNKKTNRQTASYKLLYKMLKAFQSRVEAIELVELSPEKMREWTKLLRATKSGSINYEKAEEKMMALMEAASVGSSSSRKK